MSASVKSGNGLWSWRRRRSLDHTANTPNAMLIKSVTRNARAFSFAYVVATLAFPTNGRTISTSRKDKPESVVNSVPTHGMVNTEDDGLVSDMESLMC